MEIAVETAKEINQEDCWVQLSESAIRHGNHEVNN